MTETEKLLEWCGRNGVPIVTVPDSWPTPPRPQADAPAAQPASTEAQAGTTGDFALQPQPATLKPRATFYSTKRKQPTLIPDLWRDALPGQQGLFTEDDQ